MAIRALRGTAAGLNGTGRAWPPIHIPCKRASDRLRGSVKITINIDQGSLALLRAMAAETGVPYQRLPNAMLKKGMKERESTETRHERPDRELKRVKRHHAASREALLAAALDPIRAGHGHYADARRDETAFAVWCVPGGPGQTIIP